MTFQTALNDPPPILSSCSRMHMSIGEFPGGVTLHYLCYPVLANVLDS
jgi:hypothetical protein